MKSLIIKLLIYQIIELFEIIQSDHVQVIHCAEHPMCLENVNGELLNVIKENLLNTSEPCENFWDYACGSWTAAPYYDHVDNFGAMANYYADNLIKTLERLNKKSNENRDIYNLIQQITKYFKSCSSAKSYYLNMWNYLKEIEEQVVFGANFQWEFLTPENFNIWHDFEWFSALANLRKYGLNGVFLYESVTTAWNDSLLNVLQLKIPNPPANFQNKYKILQLMEEFDFFQNPNRNWLKLAQELYDFEQELVELFKKYQTSKSDHFITFNDLENLVPFLDWPQYFEILLDHPIRSDTSIEFLGDMKYFQDLFSFLSQKPKKIVGFYVLLRFCKYLLDIRPLVTDRECLMHTNVMFPLGINYIYDRFLYKTRQVDDRSIQNIFSQLKQQFAKNLGDNKFALSPTEMDYLLKKLHLMQLQIGNLPSEISDINDYYSSAQLWTNNFYHNHLEMLKLRSLLQHASLLNSSQFLINPRHYYVNDDISQLRNAPYFIHQRNKLIVPMLFLQLPFYHHSQHTLLQYSLVGWIIAHELSHAFDSHGLYYDAWGNENVIGLQISQKISYLSATNCLKNYSPTVSLNERIADVNGLQLAWQAYSQQFSLVPELSKEFSLQELFFINFAQFFCGSLPRAIAHDRDDVRVKVTVANMQEFSEVFHCSKGAKENPREKCNIWRL